MKKLILSILILGLILVGCSDDDNPTASSTPTLTEAACDAEGGEWEESSTTPATLNADGTISAEQTVPAECYDDYDEEVEVADKAACDAANGSWQDTYCYTMVFTLSTGQ